MEFAHNSPIRIVVLDINCVAKLYDTICVSIFGSFLKIPHFVYKKTENLKTSNNKSTKTRLLLMRKNICIQKFYHSSKRHIIAEKINAYLLVILEIFIKISFFSTFFPEFSYVY
jgi:hypothetical protein